MHSLLSSAVRQLEKLNPDSFELYYTRKTSTRVDSKNQEIDSLTRAEDEGMALRILKDQKLGFSFTTRLEEPAIAQMIQTAEQVATVLPEDPHFNLFPLGSAVYPAVDQLDSKGPKASIEEKVNLARQLESECRRADRRIVGVRAASFSETLYETHMVDSQGESVSHQGSLYTASITCKAEEGGDSQVGHEMNYSNFLDNLDVISTGRLAAQWATELIGAGSAPTMKCPAVIRNSVVAELLDFISASFSAEEVDKGRSLLRGKQGERIFSELITLHHDGLLAGGFATSPFDAEGVPSTRLTLVHGGFLNSFLYNLYYAKKFGAQPSGCSVRGIKSPPSIGISNFYIEKGRKMPEQLIDGISKGILITDLMGIHTANPVTGDFSLGASGILIENGKLTRPVRGFAVAGKILDLFKGVTDVGSDLRFFGNVGAPSIQLNELSVGGV